MSKRIKVLVIDDSALARELLSKGLSAYSDIEVIGTASDVYVARDKIVLRNPDVLTLDIEMPRMDGLEFLRRLMPQYPIPVIIVSALAENGARATIEALKYGAVDYVLKPSSRIGSNADTMLEDLHQKIQIAATVDVSGWKARESSRISKHARGVIINTTDKVVAIGASTGGTEAVRKLVASFPPDMPGTVVVQHMPPVFTAVFADSLNALGSVEVKEAQNGDRVMTGRVLVAPGDKHIVVQRSGGEYRVRCSISEKVNGHRPSVDVLFDSIARHVGSNAVGVILTGMGRDGADAMLNMKRAGARTSAQDEETSVVFGMPKEAFVCGGAERLVPLEDIPTTLMQALGEMK